MDDRPGAATGASPARAAAGVARAAVTGEETMTVAGAFATVLVPGAVEMAADAVEGLTAGAITAADAAGVGTVWPSAAGLLSVQTSKVRIGSRTKYFQTVWREERWLFIITIRRFKSD